MWRLTRVGVRLICVLFVSQAAVLMGVKLVGTGNDSDPLAPYAAILPGQPAEALENYSCNWFSEYFQRGMIGVCRSSLEDDRFASVNISVDALTITSLLFHVSDLSVGDLARYWGRPVVIDYGQTYLYARWQRSGYQVTANMLPSRHFSYWLPVYVLSIEKEQESEAV